VGEAAVDRLHAVAVHVDADDAEAGAGVGQGQRQADIAEADDGNGGLAGADAVVESRRILGGGFEWGQGSHVLMLSGALAPCVGWA